MKKTNLFIYEGQSETLLTILSNNENEQCPFYNAEVVEQLNKDFTLEFTIPGNHEDSIHLKKGNLVAFKDLDDNVQVFQIYKTEEERSDDIAHTRVFCEHIFYELIDDIVEDLRVNNGDVIEALTKALSNSRWKVGEVAPLGNATLNFYYSNGIENIQKVANTYEGELNYRIDFEGNKIVDRFVDLLSRRGSETGKRFEYTKDLTSIKRTIDMSGIKTALYGRGNGEETEEGGYTRRITFKEVVWSVDNGDPVNKPFGQEWIGLPEALQNFGRENGTRHRVGIFEVDSTDPQEILQETYKQLLEVSKPRITYEMSVIDLEKVTGMSHEKVRLGDTVVVIDKTFKPAIRIEARVVEIKRVIDSPEDTEIILGNFIPMFTDIGDRVSHIESKLNERSGVWDKVESIDVEVTDTSFPDTKPPTPTNFQAQGLFRSITLKWDFDPSSFIAGYEVFASPTPNFEATPERLVFRGKTGGHIHEAQLNETWYFKVRAFNTHGTCSDLSPEISASTIQINEFEIDDMFRAGIVEEVNLYTDERRDEVMSEVVKKAGLEYVEGQLQTKADKETTYTKTEVDNAVNSRVAVTQYETDQQGIVTRFEDAETRITQNETDIIQRATKTELEQVENEVGALGTRMSNAETEISQNAIEIELRATKTELNTEKQRIDDVQSTLSVHSGQIQARVEKNGVISSINQTPESIKISANRIQLTGDVTIEDGLTKIGNAVIDKSMLKNAIIENVHIANGTIEHTKIASVNADKITTGKITAVDIEGVNISGVSISGSTFVTNVADSNNQIKIEGTEMISTGVRRFRNWWDLDNWYDRLQNASFSKGFFSITDTHVGSSDGTAGGRSDQAVLITPSLIRISSPSQALSFDENGDFIDWLYSGLEIKEEVLGFRNDYMSANGEVWTTDRFQMFADDGWGHCRIERVFHQATPTGGGADVISNIEFTSGGNININPDMLGVISLGGHTIVDNGARLQRGANNTLTINTGHNTLTIGSQNSNWAHYTTGASNGHYFFQPISVNTLRVRDNIIYEGSGSNGLPWGWNEVVGINNNSHGAIHNRTGKVALGLHENGTMFGIQYDGDPRYTWQVSRTRFSVNANVSLAAHGGIEWEVPPTTPSMRNGWETYFGTGYMKSPDGIVYLRGLMRGGTRGQPAFTLPVGCRPLNTTRVFYQGTGFENGIVRVDISTNGNVTVQTQGTYSQWVSLEGICFNT